MNPRDRGEVGARRDVARQHLERLALKRAFDRAQAVGPLGMAFAHVVREAGGVTDEERGHVLGVLLGDFAFSPPLVSRSFAPRARESPCRHPVRGWRMDVT